MITSLGRANEGVCPTERAPYRSRRTSASRGHAARCAYRATIAAAVSPTAEQSAASAWREEAGRNARAASGWEQTLEAASDARVELLLFQEGADRPAFRCPACGRAEVSEGSCPLDGTRLEPTDAGLDLAVHQTLAHGGAVWAIRHHQDLAPVEGIGALLRF